MALFFLYNYKIDKALALTIINPENKTYVTTPFLYLIAKMDNEEATHVMITVNDIKSPLIYIKGAEYVSQFKDFIIIDTELEEGENLITITILKEGKLIEEKKIIIYFIKAPKVPAKDIKHYAFHKDEKEKVCLNCHTSIADNCTECHKRIISKKYVHGPAGSGDCVVCHTPQTEDGIKYKITVSVDKLCANCHDNMNLNSYMYAHGPFATGSCEVCHDLHSSDYPHQLKMETNDLCISCHQEFKRKDITHVVTKHPLGGKKDPSRPGKMLQCSSCHNPHGESTPVFFVRGVKNRMELCGICHRK